jgi:hypothetical protein
MLGTLLVEKFVLIICASCFLKLPADWTYDLNTETKTRIFKPPISGSFWFYNPADYKTTSLYIMIIGRQGKKISEMSIFCAADAAITGLLPPARFG